MAGIDINRTTSGVLLPKELSSEIWAETLQGSAVAQFAQPRRMPASGVDIQTITGEPEAEWVAETEEKPVSRHTLGSRTFRPYKLAVIEPFSDEFRRDKAGLYRELARRMPNALARKIDETVFHGTPPGSGFDVLSDVATATLDTTDTYGDLVNVDVGVSDANGVVTGWVLSPKARGVLLRAVVDGRPLLINDIQRENSVGSLLGAPVTLNRAVYKADEAGDEGEVLGFAGDWNQVYYGTVEGVKISMSDQATLQDGATSLNLWQRNMFAIRAEIEVGVFVKDKAVFRKILSGVNTVA